jgi:hypothetical protein
MDCDQSEILARETCCADVTSFERMATTADHARWGNSLFYPKQPFSVDLLDWDLTQCVRAVAASTQRRLFHFETPLNSPARGVTGLRACGKHRLHGLKRCRSKTDTGPPSPFQSFYAPLPTL